MLIQLDWERLCNNNQYSGPTYEPDIAAFFKVICEKHRRDIWDAWAHAAKAEAKKQWAYAELVDDHADNIPVFTKG